MTKSRYRFKQEDEAYVLARLVRAEGLEYQVKLFDFHYALGVAASRGEGDDRLRQACRFWFGGEDAEAAREKYDSFPSHDAFLDWLAPALSSSLNRWFEAR